MSTSPTSPGKVQRILRLRRSASDLDRAIRFYVDGLGFVVEPNLSGDGANTYDATDDPTSDTTVDMVSARVVRLRLGEESIELFWSTGTTRRAGADRSNAAVSSNAFQHIAIVTNDMAAALRRLARLGAQPISNADADRLGVTLPPAAGQVTAYKFRDPDGHPLELIAFPPGTGDSRWQAPGNAATGTGPTLGIDHSAIGVLNADRSIVFYRDMLGFRVDARQTNHGPEQARLDGVGEAVVEVVAMLPADSATPHLELLAYRSPPASGHGPLAPIQEDPSDRLTFVVDDLEAIVHRLAAARPALSQEPSHEPSQERLHEQLAVDPQVLLLRDDDGHLLLLMQAP